MYVCVHALCFVFLSMLFILLFTYIFLYFFYLLSLADLNICWRWLKSDFFFFFFIFCFVYFCRLSFFVLAIVWLTKSTAKKQSGLTKDGIQWIFLHGTEVNRTYNNQDKRGTSFLVPSPKRPIIISPSEISFRFIYTLIINL